jgi:hypothetical protein
MKFVNATKFRRKSGAWGTQPSCRLEKRKLRGQNVRRRTKRAASVKIVELVLPLEAQKLQHPRRSRGRLAIADEPLSLRRRFATSSKVFIGHVD